VKSSGYAFVRKVATAVAVACALAGYWFVGRIVPETGCGPVTYSQGMNCGIVESLVYRFSNFASLLGAFLFALPAMLVGFWAWGREDDGPAKG